jgi:ubiquinone/menaquinone biosynthesis C-methylase UbiE
VKAIATYTPPLGFAKLTPFYDAVVRLLTREKAWRSCLAKCIDAQPNERIVDVGAGTGSLAIAVTARSPNCEYLGIDPDAQAIGRARRKAALAGSPATFRIGFLAKRESGDALADKIVSSLVFHQVPLAEKLRILETMFDWLKPGGKLFIADYGEQKSAAMRLAFRATVQMLDGRADTQPNADGILPKLIGQAGFERLSVLDEFSTSTGNIEIMRAERPGARRHGIQQ